MGNPYQSIHVDTLHQSDIGIFKMIVGIYREIAETTPGLRILEKLDQRLSQIKHGCRYPGFRIPGMIKVVIFAPLQTVQVLNIDMLCRYVHISLIVKKYQILWVLILVVKRFLLKLPGAARNFQSTKKMIVRYYQTSILSMFKASG